MSRLPTSTVTSILESPTIERRTRQRNQLGLNDPNQPRRVNPSGPPLAARAQRETELAQQGVDTTRLRTMIQGRRSENQAMLARRRALGLKAAELRRRGDASGAELVAAQIAELEGGRMAAAQETAQMNRLERRGVGDADLIARVAQRQEMAQARERLAMDAQGAQLDSARMGIDTNREVDATRLALARAGRGSAEFGLEAQDRTRDRRMTLEERTLDNTLAQTDVEAKATTNRLQQLELEQATLSDAIKNAPEDLDLRRQLERSQVEAARLQNQLTARQTQTGIAAEDATAQTRVEMAQASAEAQRNMARSQADESVAPDESISEQTGITDPEVAAKSLVQVPRTLAGLRGSEVSETTDAQLETVEDEIKAVQLSMTRQQFAAYAKQVLADLDRQRSDSGPLGTAGIREKTGFIQGIAAYVAPTASQEALGVATGKKARMIEANRRYRGLVEMLEAAAKAGA